MYDLKKNLAGIYGRRCICMIAVIFVCGFLMFAKSASAATITAAKSGNWSDTSVWTGGVLPGNTSTADCVGFTVTIDMDLIGTNAPATISSSNTTGHFSIGATRQIGDGTHNVTIAYTGTNTSGLVEITSGTTTTYGNISNSSSGYAVVTSNAANLVIASGTVSGTSLYLTGTGSLTVNSGVVNLTNANTFSGGTTLNSGTLGIRNSQALGTVAGTFTINGGSLDADNGSINTLNYPMIWGGDFTYIGSFGNTLNFGTGAVTLVGTRQITVNAGTGSLTIGGIIGDGGQGYSLTKAGAGILTLSGTNTFTGGFTLNAGTVNIKNAQALGTSAGTFTINGGSIDDTGSSFTMVNYPMAWNGDFSYTGSNGFTLGLGSGVVTPNGSRIITVNTGNGFGGIKVGGNIGGGAISLTKSGAGKLELSGVNTFTGGVILNAGTLGIENTQALGTVAGTFTINGGTLYNGSGGTINTLNYPMVWNGNFTFIDGSQLNLGGGAVNMNATTTITVGSSTSLELTVGGVISGTGYGLIQTGTGKLKLNGVNSFTGGIVFSGTGLLTLGANYTAGNISITDTSATTKTFAGGGHTFGNLTVSGDNVIITGSNTFNTLAVNTAGLTNGLLLQSGNTQTISSLTTNGHALTLAKLVASTTDSAATLSKASGTVSVDYMSIQDSTATGGAAWYAGANSTNVSGNSGWSFTAPAGVASITQGSISAITATSSTASSSITATGGANVTNDGFAYGTDPTFATVIATTTNPGSWGTGDFTATLSSLACNTTYYVRPYAVNPAGLTTATFTNFTTGACGLSALSTYAASSITQTSAILYGVINSTGGGNATQSGFEYGTDPTMATIIATTTSGSQIGTASFNSSISSLTSGTTYYYRAYAINPAGLSYGSIRSFSSNTNIYYVDSTAGVDPGFSGTLTGNATWTSSGYYDSGIVFDGGINGGTPTSYVSVGSSAILAPAQWTISAWIKANATTTGQALFKPSYGDGYSSGWKFVMDQNGRLSFGYGNGTSHVGDVYTPPGTDYRGAWHIVTATFDGTTVTIYVDGASKISSSTPTVGYLGSTGSHQAWVGASEGSNALNGTMDEVRFYNRALSANEISNWSSSIPINGLIFYLPFHEGTGTVTQDPSNNDGLSQASPWKTLSKVSAYTFQPGNSVLFKRGDTWHETLTLPASGSAGNPITFGAYGIGSNPIIDAADPITGWVPYGGNIWVASSSAVSQVFVDGNYYDAAHYPDSGYNTITQTSADKLTLVDSNLNPPGSVIGANIFVRSSVWYIDMKTITTYDSGTHTISWIGNLNSTPTLNYGYYLSNKLWMLDQSKEWVYDSSSGNIYIWLDGNANPNSHVIESSTRNNGIYGNGKSYITLQDLDIRNATTNGVETNGIASSTIQRLSVSGSAQSGMYLYNYATSLANMTVASNTLSNNIQYGINFVYQISSSTSSITNNLVTNTGNVGYPKGTFDGIYVHANRVSANNNLVLNSGYIGMSFAGNNNVLQNNYIDSSCLVLSDCAGIYTYANAGTGNQVLGNVITNSIGNYAGTPITGGFASNQAEGVYMDDFSNGTTVSGNTVFNTGWGIYIHHAYNNTITNNTVFGSRSYGLAVIENPNDSPQGVAVNNTISGNLFISTSTSASVFLKGSTGNMNFGTFDSDYVVGDYYSTPITQVVSNVTTNYTLLQWQTFSNQDASTKDINDTYKINTTGHDTTNDFLLYYSTSTTDKVINFGSNKYTDVDGNVVTGLLTLAPFTSKVLLNSFNNNDGVCNNNETYATAPADCPLTAPTLLQASISSITATAATASSTITATGGANATNRGFAYGTDPTFATVIATTTDPGNWGTGAFSANLSSLTCNTTYYVRAYAVNSAGTTTASLANFTTTACVPSAPTSVTATAGNTRATVSFGTPSNGGATITSYTVTSSPDNIASSSASSPIVVNSLTNGHTYTFTVTATNSAGTGSASSPSNSITLDGTAPTTTNHLPTGTYGASQSVTLTCADNVGGVGCDKIYYSIDGTDPTLVYSSSISISANTTLKFYSTDMNGNAETVQTANYIIDATYPFTTITPNSIAATTSTAASFTFSANKAGSTYECKLDGTSFASCSSPQSLSGLSDGSHTFTVRATDTLTHVEPSPPFVTWTVDTTPPSAFTLSSPSDNSVTASQHPTFIWNDSSDAGSGLSKYQLYIDGTLDTDNISASTPFSASTASLTRATHTWYVKAFDAVGNTTQSNTLHVVVANVPTVSDQAANPIATTSATLNGSIDADGSASSTARGFEYGQTSSYGSLTSTSGTYNLGSFSASLTQLTCNTGYYFRAFATNIAGTASSTGRQFTTSACPVGVTLPTLSTPTSSVTSGTTATLSGSITDDGNASSTVEGFNYGTSQSYGQTASSNGTYGIGSFSQDLTGLTCGTTYHYESFATNSAGTQTSSDQSFTTNACPTTGGGPTGGNSFSSGGGGGGYYVPLLATTTATTTQPANCPRGFVCTANPTRAFVPSIPLFTRNLTLGSTGSDVKYLQIFLNTQGFIIAKNGSGSAGNETTYFGPATKAALIRFQNAHASDILTPSGLTAGTGFFGPATIAVVNKMLGSQATTASTTSQNQIVPNTPTVALTFARDLQLGSTGDDVRQLQIILNSQGFTVAQTGPGSSGNETNVFGSATKNALMKFQKANNLPATGFFGPLTRKVVGQ